MYLLTITIIYSIFEQVLIIKKIIINVSDIMVIFTCIQILITAKNLVIIIQKGMIKTSAIIK